MRRWMALFVAAVLVASLSGCALLQKNAVDFVEETRIVTAETPEATPVPQDIPEIAEGTWWDTDSQRCHMTVEKISADSYSVIAEWSSSAEETDMWAMTATYDSAAGCFRYAGGVHSVSTYADGGTGNVQTVYTDGTGNLTLNREYLYWTDDVDHVRDGCAFVFAE